MKTKTSLLLAGLMLAIPTLTSPVWAEPMPQPAGTTNVPISHHDRVYAAEQFSNTVSVTDPADNHVLGVIRLGDPAPGNLSPLYRGQLLVHGLGFSPDHKTIAAVAIASNSVTFIDTATNKVLHTTYVGRSPHEVFYTPNGREVWVTVRGEDYIAVLDPKTFQETGRIQTAGGPGMQIFSPDGKYGYVCSSFNPIVQVFDVATHKEVGKVVQGSPFCPNIAATADGKQVWFTLKDTGKVQVFNARPPFDLIKTIDTGPITNHVNFARTAKGQFAYVTVGGLNQVQVYSTETFEKVATIPVGTMPHGIWPSGDGTRVYAGLENGDGLAVIDTASNTVVATLPIGQGPQALVYVPDAVPTGDGTAGLQPLGLAGHAWHLVLGDKNQTSVTLYDQGLPQVLQAAVTGLAPKSPYVLALAPNADGSGVLQPVAAFMTNPAGGAIVDTVGPIRQLVDGDTPATRRYLVIAAGTPDQLGAVVQRQVP